MVDEMPPASAALSRIDGTTRLFGVIGDPIAQIKTPGVINPIFAQLSANILCIPLHVSERGLAAAWQGLRRLNNLVGFGVTLPHKSEIARLCDRLEPNAQRVGVVNCVRREPDGSMVGGLFDGIGFIAGLTSQGHDVAGHDVLLIGAGGAAAAVAFALADAGASRLVIANRTPAAAQRLVERIRIGLGVAFASVGSADPADYSLVINCTSLGLKPDDPLPVDPGRLSAQTLVADVIPTPEITALLRQAQRRGCSIHSGIHMITGQARLIAEFVCDNRAGAEHATGAGARNA